MRTVITRIFIVLAIVPLALAVLLLALNVRDEPLRAEVRKIWDASPPVPSEAGRRAYLYLLGLAAGERTDPEKRGAELWPQLGEKSVRDALDSTGWAKSTFAGGDDCGVADLTPANLAVLNETQVSGRLYAGWMDFADYASLSPPLAIPGPRAHRLYLLRLAQWLSQGGDERAWQSLANSNQFYSRALATGPLALRVTALTNLALNARFVANELTRRPATRVPGELIATWRVPDLDDVLAGALVGELRRLAFTLGDLATSPERFALRPNETANRVYEIFTQSLFTDCPRNERACVPALAYAGWGRPAHWLINPRGRDLVVETSRGLAERPTLKKLIAEILDLKAQLRRRP